MAPQSPNPSAFARPTRSPSQPSRSTSSSSTSSSSTSSSSTAQPTAQPGQFHNPYNFVPTLPRHNVTGELGDRLPVGHSCYLDHHWSGRIRVTLTTTTPLLIPDAALAQKWQGNSEHQTMPLRLVDGQPYLPPTSIKGALRSAYEAITNSRFSVFSQHETELAYRMLPNPKVQPARLIKGKNGQLQLVIMQSAKLLCYETYHQKATAPPDKGASKIARENNYPGHKLPEHGDPLWVKISQGRAKTVQQFQPRQHDEKEKAGWQKAWACITGANCNEKRYERVFILPKKEDIQIIEVGQREIDLWQKLIADYRTIHQRDLQDRQQQQQLETAYLGHEPGQTAWSRHLLSDRPQEIKFKPGTLCYVLFNSQGEIESVLPVTISRQLFKVAPSHLLAESLKPSTDITKLSPADRVFGWVNPSGNGAYRGQLRIPSVRCLTPPEQAIESFTTADQNPQTHPGLPLTILGAPKPQQTRFYIARDQKGTPLADKTDKSEGYQSKQQGLRGRKVYPHHQAIANQTEYWQDALRDRTQSPINGYYQEYRRPRDAKGNEQRDSQNRSIQAWVRPATQFQFDIEIINLSSVELGALLWLLQLPAGHYHRIGGGKPLGFGSVMLTVNWADTDLRTGQDWVTYYHSLTPIIPPDSKVAKDCIAIYEAELLQAYGKASNATSCKDIRLLQAFLQAAQGLEKPIHYPRTTTNPTPEGENFAWFTDNESQQLRSLPPLWQETGL